MGPTLLGLAALAFLGAASKDTEVTQTPGRLVRGAKQKARMECEPIKGHSYVYWYQQKPGEELKLLVYLVNEKVVDSSGMPDNRFSAKCPQDLPCHMEIEPTEPGDSAVYFCASNRALNSPLHFGQGTTLTVTENLDKVAPPKVTLFEPSEAEITHTQKATLVCLATGFYPDHVELRWLVNGQETRSGVSTDPQPLKEHPSEPASTYCLSSRLRVSATFWHNQRNHFSCQVRFYGLSDEDEWPPSSTGSPMRTRPKPVTQNVSAEAWRHADCGITSRSYRYGILSATVLYEVLLGKAALYAVLVSALVLVAMVKKKNP